MTVLDEVVFVLDCRWLSEG